MEQQTAYFNRDDICTVAQVASQQYAPHVTNEFAELIRRNGTSKTFEAGQVIFLEDDPSDAVFLVVSGTVRCCRITADGRRQISRFISDGEEMALTAFKSYDYTAEAITDITVLSCPRTVFEAALQTDDALQEFVFEKIANELTRGRDQMVLLGRLTAVERAAAFLFRLARHSNAPNGELYLTMTREDIADYLGMTLETVSRMFNQLKRDGVIEMRTPDHIRIRNADQLADLAMAA